MIMPPIAVDSLAAKTLAPQRVHIYHHYGIRSLKHYRDGLLGPTSIMVVYMGPLDSYDLTVDSTFRS